MRKKKFVAGCLFLLSLLCSQTLLAQITVSGTVTDQDGRALPGVSVTQKGSDIGVSTDMDGKYSLQTDEDAVLVFSLLGFGAVEEPINGRTTINVLLSMQTSQLDEIVVVGYGTQRKGDLTGAVSTISAEDFARVPATNPLQAFQGRVPGLSITSSSGLPGAGASVQIRGVQSINGTNSPIFVVDGVITSNINNINPSDIESVSVLKDASSTAIYGARAANGVIIVNTKSGKGKTVPEITFNSYVGMQQQGNMKLELLNAQQFLEIYTEAYNNAEIAVPWTEEDLAHYTGVNTNWMDLITRTGVIENYNLGVSGGSKKSNYNVSAGYITNKGMVLGTDYNRFTFHLNSDHRIADWIRFGNSLNLYANETNGSAYPYRIAATKVPLTRAYEDNGDYGKIFNTALEHQYSNPIWMTEQIVNKRSRKGILGNLYLTIEPLEGLEFTARANVEWNNTHRTNFSPGVDPLYGWEGSNQNFVEKEDEQSLHWITDFTANYKNTFGEDHAIQALLGYSVEENTYENLYGSRSNTPNNSIQYLGAGDPTTQLNENGMNDWAFISTFARLNYTYKDKYLFTGSIRRDGTSRLAKGNPYGVFPSAAFAWRLSEETFMDNAEFVNDLKLRASWGAVGNVLSVGQYATVPTLSQWNYVLNEVPVQGYTGATSINQNLKWESSKKKNLGVDAALFNNRLYTSIDYFIEDTQNLLFQQRIPSSTGFSNNPYINAGKVRNTGYEMMLGYRGHANDWNYDFNINFSHVKNEVIDLEGRDLRTQGVVEGFPVKSYFGYETNGLIYSQEDLENHPQMNGKQIGDIWIKDINGLDENGELTGVPDGEISSADRTLIGKRYPDLLYGAMASVGYKNWTFQLQLQGIQGVDKNILGEYYGVFHYFTRWAMNSDASVMDRYHAEKNPDGQLPRVSTSDNGHNREFSDFWLKNASFLRIKNVNLNYSFPPSMLKSFVKYLGVYVSVQNLYTFTNFTGTEVDTGSDPLTGAPQPRTFTFGLRATF